MDTLKQLKEELTEEYQTTKKFFELFPDGKNGYAPHPKSMKLMPLAQHVAEVFGWADIVLKTDSIDFASGDRPQPFSSRQELLDALEKNHAVSIEALSRAAEADLLPLWSVTYNGHKVGEWTKYGAIRHSLNQATHHRAQLGVYYRLNDIKVPGSYGPSADEM
ncbi:hypothetical protein GCM10023091_22210 [Ravibacter arvi]|uniref:Damage-inducible protein DinB n=1 Tax=Ravibacter arvi TaxID=2051041 RepID=A0ABP8LZH9_9BACT